MSLVAAGQEVKFSAQPSCAAVAPPLPLPLPTIACVSMFRLLPCAALPCFGQEQGVVMPQAVVVAAATSPSHAAANSLQHPKVSFICVQLFRLTRRQRVWGNKVPGVGGI